MTSFKHLSVAELNQQLAEQSNTIQVVDIRDPQSFHLGRIPGATHLTNDSLADFMRDADLDAPTVVCCYHGVSSQQAAQYLASQDFSDVYSLDGGYTAWQLSFPDNIEK